MPIFAAGKEMNRENIIQGEFDVSLIRFFSILKLLLQCHRLVVQICVISFKLFLLQVGRVTREIFIEF
jgi:hypothetical protein